MPQPIEINTPLVIWRIIDGKPGHENQTLGLANAMRRLAEQSQRECVVLDIPANRKQAGPISFLRRHFLAGEGLPAPDFILAAGSGTHWSLLCAQRRYGGKSVVLMKPSLPLGWFDWVVVPEHDGVTGKNVITTKGVLNPMRPSEKVPGSVLVLVGGESKHYAWDEKQVLQEVCSAKNHWPALKLTDSRRTPESLKLDLKKQIGHHYLPWEVFSSDLFRAELAKTELVIVTADSVSMIYEALSAGCQVLLIMPGCIKRNTRVVKGVHSLIQDGWISLFQVPWPKKQIVLDEAFRIATKLLEA